LDDILEDIEHNARTAPIGVVQRPAAEATRQTPPAPRHVRVRRNPALASGSAADLLTEAQAAVAAWAGTGRATAPKRSLPLDISTVTIPQPAARAARHHPPHRFPPQTSRPPRHPFSPPEAAPTAQQQDSPHPATPPPGVNGHRGEVPPHSHRLHELTRIIVQHADTGHVSTHIFTEALHNAEPSPTTSRQRHSLSNAQTRPSPGMRVSGTTPDAYAPPCNPTACIRSNRPEAASLTSETTCSSATDPTPASITPGSGPIPGCSGGLPSHGCRGWKPLGHATIATRRRRSEYG
jgi:hypothetical protein